MVRSSAATVEEPRQSEILWPKKGTVVAKKRYSTDQKETVVVKKMCSSGQQEIHWPKIGTVAKRGTVA